MKQTILSQLPTDHPWRDRLIWYDTIDSTNTRAKAMAAQGAPEGTVIIAGSQTGGRGRLGRSFHSPAGSGLYLSVILRPACPPAELMHLTCIAAVAACNAVEAATGFRPCVKWINDLVAENRKLGGILTELSISSKTGLVDYAVIGIGINCNQTTADFPEDIAGIATSLKAITGKEHAPAALAAGIMLQLHSAQLQIADRSKWMAQYRRDCITVGKDIVVLRAEEKRYGKAVDITDDGSLTVVFSDGTQEDVSSGEVSIRGMYGYV